MTVNRSLWSKIVVLMLVFIMAAGITAFAAEPGSASGLPDRFSIVLFGLSGDNGGLDTNRTDSIIVVTVDNEYKQLKFTSVLRDIKASIEGHEPQKINAAYRYGGPELALQTLNENFDLNLKDYITLTFWNFEYIVDRLGGVHVDLTEAEADYMNWDEYVGNDFTAGPRLLNGTETLEYCRIRKIDSDVQRSARQRKVLVDLMDTVTSMNPVEARALMNEFVQGVESTSLTPASIITLLSIPYKEYEVINNHFPDADLDNDVWGGIDEHGEWVWFMDLESAGVRFNDIINNQQPVQASEE